jgi:hypothetical protein
MLDHHDGLVGERFARLPWWRFVAQRGNRVAELRRKLAGINGEIDPNIPRQQARDRPDQHLRRAGFHHAAPNNREDR